MAPPVDHDRLAEVEASLAGLQEELAELGVRLLALEAETDSALALSLRAERTQMLAVQAQLLKTRLFLLRQQQGAAWLWLRGARAKLSSPAQSRPPCSRGWPRAWTHSSLRRERHGGSRTAWCLFSPPSQRMEGSRALRLPTSGVSVSAWMDAERELCLSMTNVVCEPAGEGALPLEPHQWRGRDDEPAELQRITERLRDSDWAEALWMDEMRSVASLPWVIRRRGPPPDAWCGDVEGFRRLLE